MKKIAAVLLLTAVIATPAYATLKVGDKAPDFTAQASLGGKEFKFSLADALKEGPVVLYFYPAAFTKGCTVEAHDFAEATDEFKKLGATVIGISHDKIDTLDKFSVSDCRSKFAVAADPDGKVIESYDAKIPLLPYSSRTSYVISPAGEILMEYSDMNPDQHVAKTMEAVKKWDASHH
ncbi:MAG TPA: peroxiredoxin [Rhizomicrobium sp.]|nr:peroxiredoxin [Rhizomicrobium sp.]